MIVVKWGGLIRSCNDTVQRVAGARLSTYSLNHLPSDRLHTFLTYILLPPIPTVADPLMDFQSAFKNRWSRKKEPATSPSAPVAASSSTLPQYPHPSSSTPPPMSASKAYTAALPHYNRLPISNEATHPLRVLYDLFLYSPHSRKGWFNATAHATILRQLFFSIWYNQEWMGLFELDSDPDGSRMPTSKDINDWVFSDEEGMEKPWRLKDYQRGLRTKPEVSPGRSCGKVMERYDRTYTCK